MKMNLTLLLFILITLRAFSQIPIDEFNDEKCYIVEDNNSTQNVQNQNNTYAPYGKVFTPKGTIKALAIYVGFDSDCYDENSHPDNYTDSKWTTLINFLGLKNR